MYINEKDNYPMILDFKDTKYINYAVLKNANMYLGLVYLKHKYGEDFYRGPVVLFNTLLRECFINNQHIVNNKELYKDYKSFVVYRNPFDRLLSYYKYFYTRPTNFENRKIINEQMPIKEFIDTYVSLQHKDYHCMRQMFYINRFNPDIIVPIEKLNDFCKNELKLDYKVEKFNESVNIDEDKINEFKSYRNYFEQIEIYKDDFNILKTYSDKVYK